MDMRCFFEPESIAVIGASQKSDRPGYAVVDNLIQGGFEGTIYPVNPTANEILGWKAYPTVRDIPGRVDLGVSLVASEETTKVVENCAAKGIKGLIIMSGGFSEAGEEGKILEENLVAKARHLGIRIMGPNVIGPINPSRNLIVSFVPFPTIKKGTVSLVAQTGQTCAVILEWISSACNIGVSKSIDLGNKADVSDVEVIEYLDEDSDTKVIAIHTEEIKNGRRLIEIARKVSQHKPILMLKTGRSEAGAKAAASHTGSLAGDEVICDAALKQAGIIRVKDLEELIDFAKAFAFLPLPQGDRVGVISASGGAGVWGVDACQSCGLKVSNLAEETLYPIKEINPPWVRISNPVDLGAAAPVCGMSEAYQRAVKAVASDPNVDALAMMIPALNETASGSVLVVSGYEIMGRFVRQEGKPMTAWTVGRDDRVREVNRALEQSGIPTFPSMERAINALGAVCRYANYIHNRQGTGTL